LVELPLCERIKRFDQPVLTNQISHPEGGQYIVAYSGELGLLHETIVISFGFWVGHIDHWDKSR